MIFLKLLLCRFLIRVDIFFLAPEWKVFSHKSSSSSSSISRLCVCVCHWVSTIYKSLKFYFSFFSLVSFCVCVCLFQVQRTRIQEYWEFMLCVWLWWLAVWWMMIYETEREREKRHLISHTQTLYKEAQFGSIHGILLNQKKEKGFFFWLSSSLFSSFSHFI